jgi:hypothetical protein
MHLVGVFERTGASRREVARHVTLLRGAWMKKPSDTMAGGLPMIPHADCGEWTASYPKLAGWMTDAVWDDGTVKQPAKLFVAISRQQWVFTLKAVGLGLILEAPVDLPEMGLEALESLLSADPVPWRVDPWEKVQQARKAKK